MIAEHSLVALDCDPPDEKLNRGDVGPWCIFTRAAVDTRWSLSTAADGRWRLSPLTPAAFGQLTLAKCFTPGEQRRWRSNHICMGDSV